MQCRLCCVFCVGVLLILRGQTYVGSVVVDLVVVGGTVVAVVVSVLVVSCLLLVYCVY